MTATYLFYDIETTGLNKCFDQVIQFAAIRTDLTLKEIERHEIRIKLNRDVIPAPEAMMIHRMGIADMQEGLSEVEGIRQIHRLLNTPETISVGYNTLGFDDEFLRFSFYRNLLPPYTHQFNHHCSRMDIYPMVVMFYLFHRDVLPWPILDNKISFKLEQINALNQFVKGQAHHAMVDVEITVALAQKLAQHAKMWEFLRGYFQKNTDHERLTQLPFSLPIAEHQFQEGLLISGKLGTAAQFQAPVMSLGQHHHYRNQTLWLRLDDENLMKTENPSIAETTFVIRKRSGESPFILPPKERFLKNLSPERRIQTDKNRLWLQQNPELVKQMVHYHQNYKYPVVKNTDCEALLYDTGFPPPFEEKLYQQFHQAPIPQKEKTAERFADPIRRELAMRLLARHYPEALSQENFRFYHHFLQQIVASDAPPINYRGEIHLTPKHAQQQITALKMKSLDVTQQQLLHDYEAYLQSIAQL